MGHANLVSELRHTFGLADAQWGTMPNEVAGHRVHPHALAVEHLHSTGSRRADRQDYDVAYEALEHTLGLVERDASARVP